MRGDDGTLHLSMAQELLIRRLDEPRHVEVPRWVSPDVPEIQGGNDGPT